MRLLLLADGKDQIHSPRFFFRYAVCTVYVAESDSIRYDFTTGLAGRSSDRCDSRISRRAREKSAELSSSLKTSKVLLKNSKSSTRSSLYCAPS